MDRKEDKSISKMGQRILLVLMMLVLMMSSVILLGAYYYPVASSFPIHSR